MARIGEWARRLGYLLRRGAAQDELRREMEAHRAMMDDPRGFGNMLRLREDAGRAWGWQWFEDLASDLRFAWRTLRQSPGFALTAILTLALGIGVNTSMFRLVNGLLLAPLYENADRVVAVRNRSTQANGDGRAISYPNYVDLREGTAIVFADLAAFSTSFVGLDAGDGVRRTMTSRVTASYFSLFGIPLALGRPFTVEEERRGDGAEVAIIGYSLWQLRGGRPDILGQTVRINSEPFTVIGVAAEGFAGEGIPGPELWMPAGSRRPRDAHYLSVVGRLRDGVAIDAVEPALATVGRRLEQAFPDSNRGYTFAMSPPPRLAFLLGATGQMTLLSGLLMLMPAIVLLVACLNLADLLLARGHVRRQELAIRSSLGGGRGRLMRQLLAEGLLLAIAGGAAGLLFSNWATSTLLSALRPVLPAAMALPAFEVDVRVLAGTAAFSLVAVLLFGAWPAWKVTGRATAIDIKQRGDDGGRPGGMRLGRALVTAQVALSLLLLASGGLFLMSVLSAATADPGFRLDGGIVLAIDGDLAGYDDAESRQSQLAIVNRLQTVPGVEAVTIASGFPFSGLNDSRSVAPAGTPETRTSAVDAVFTVVGRDHARVFGLPMLAGRDFTEGEMQPGATERVAIIDDVLAQRLWPGAAALHRQIQFVDDDGPREGQPLRVVGVVTATKHSLGNPQPFAHVYVPLGQHDGSAMMLQLRVGERREQAMLATIAREIRNVDARMPILRSETWRAHIYESVDVWLYRAGARVFTAFGVVALLLTVVGVYGVKSSLVARRTREFGIRLATGAQPRALLWQVMWEGGRITGIGIAIGTLLALGAGQFLRGILYGLNSVEPVVLITTPLILLAASLLASLVPALRATRVDPTVALRAD